MNPFRRGLLTAVEGSYRLVRPLIFRQSAQAAHEQVLRLLAACDRLPGVPAALAGVNLAVFERREVSAGGVRLPFPFMLAAGMVKGAGFADEATAAEAVRSGQNIIPGWRSFPALVGAVEMGSFTRWPRVGNAGTVMWRDAATRSTQNYVGLKNPGAKAAAAFLGERRAALPICYGINVAVSPGVTDAVQERDEAAFAVNCFVENQLRPAWFTLNISCPNTEDDPTHHQTEQRTRALCKSVLEVLKDTHIPLWVKVSPTLSDAQYTVLMSVFAETGVKAVVATNTLPQPHPEQAGVAAGVAGGRLHEKALRAAQVLMTAREQLRCPVDVIGCGGVQDANSIAAFRALGVTALQYWSALVYRGPLVAALLAKEMRDNHGN